MDYKDLIERLRNASITEGVDRLYQQSADAIQNLDISYHLEKADHERTKEELSALKAKIANLYPLAMLDKQGRISSLYYGEGTPLYTLEGIKE